MNKLQQILNYEMPEPWITLFMPVLCFTVCWITRHEIIKLTDITGWFVF